MTGVPLKHQRISRILAEEIRSGRRPAGERLPGEHTLAQRFGVSRTTVRAALAELCEEGLITTRTGKGSYVLFDGRPPDDRPGRARALPLQGVESRLRTLAVRETHDHGLAAELGLEKDAFVCVERTRELVADGTVVAYERSFLPPVPVIRELPARGLGQEPLTEVLLRAGLRPDHGEQRVRGRRIDAHEAELLHRTPGDWFLDTRRTSRAADGSFVEHAVSLLDPDHFQLTLTFG
ncbi:GntR family transcriptional regulator [Streptomyces cellostaticus]|uniref:GntR family transcriptional regulator n=1 Tax=Streptomyces cellostaticus TaxID=67285 RepID=A0A124HCV6_9ACTN|nr:GntR family transcriptional regulator [Streptomyces cellostaticus]KUM95613.1 GntR family transcriptional regulator [Streptomyces cellostaticus]GHI09802.1 GntR family transcriptional regulator [Streptomyces cellostaticus]